MKYFSGSACSDASGEGATRESGSRMAVLEEDIRQLRRDRLLVRQTSVHTSALEREIGERFPHREQSSELHADWRKQIDMLKDAKVLPTAGM
jgi:hypothetical protein